MVLILCWKFETKNERFLLPRAFQAIDVSDRRFFHKKKKMFLIEEYSSLKLSRRQSKGRILSRRVRDSSCNKNPGQG